MATVYGKRHPCPGCGRAVWGSTDRRIRCFDCRQAARAVPSARACIECGDPCRGRRLRCEPCRIEYRREVGAAAQRRWRSTVDRAAYRAKVKAWRQGMTAEQKQRVNAQKAEYRRAHLDQHNADNRRYYQRRQAKRADTGAVTMG